MSPILGISSSKDIFCANTSTGGQGTFIDSAGTITSVSDKSTPIPLGTGKFTGFNYHYGVTASCAVFQGRGAGGQKGIYILKSGVLRRLFDTTSLLPGSSSHFVDFGGMAVEDTNVVFVAKGSAGETGVYSYIDGSLSIVADTTITAPGLGTNFSRFSLLYPPTIYHKKVVFSGWTSSGYGQFTDIAGSLTKVAFTGDTIDGKIVFGASAGPGGLSTDGSYGCVIELDFSDHSEGLYTLNLSPLIIKPASVEILRSTDEATAYPNPFRAKVTIPLQLSEPTLCSVTIFNELGKEVDRILGPSILEKGIHNIDWSPKEGASGIFLCRVLEGSKSTCMLICKSR